MKTHITKRLIKQGDLNHHGTLFAGRAAEWFVETAFIAAAAEVGDSSSILCLNIHGLVFRNPVHPGEIITIKSRIAAFGNTRIVVHGEITVVNRAIQPIEGFLTFIYVDGEGKKQSHGRKLDEAADREEEEIRQRAMLL